MAFGMKSEDDRFQRTRGTEYSKPQTMENRHSEVVLHTLHSAMGLALPACMSCYLLKPHDQVNITYIPHLATCISSHYACLLLRILVALFLHSSLHPLSLSYIRTPRQEPSTTLRAPVSVWP